MTLSGFERLGIDDEPGATWIIPSALSARELHETYNLIDKHRRDPVMQYGDDGDPLNAEEMLRRKANTAPKKKVDYDDDSEGDGIIDDGEEDFLFGGGGPVDEKTKKNNALKDLKKKRRRRRHTPTSDNDDGGLSDGTKERRRKSKYEAELERRSKYKSTEFVVDSDADSDADSKFFEKEEAMRKGQKSRVMEALKAGRVEKKSEGVLAVANNQAKRKGEVLDAERGKRGKRKKASPPVDLSDEDDDDIMALDDPDAGSSSPLAKNTLGISSGDEDTDTPLSSPHPASSQLKAQTASSQDGIGRKVQDIALSTGVAGEEETAMAGADGVMGGSDSEEDQVVKRPSGRRKQTLFVSDDSE